MLRGIDLNSNNNISNFSALPSQIDVLINKATEGNYYSDAYFDYRYRNCKTLGIKFGAYHFAGNVGAEVEAQAFYDMIKNYNLDTVLWLDIELPPSSYSWTWTKATAIAFVNTFIAKLKQLTGRTDSQLGIYTNYSFYVDWLRGNISSELKLWIARYGVNELGISGASWQYAERGSINGIDGDVDMDYFQENILNESGSGIMLDTIVVSGVGPDEMAASYLADFLQCPVVTTYRSNFDYSQVPNVFAVGGETSDYQKVTTLLAGPTRYDTLDAVLSYMKTH